MTTRPWIRTRSSRSIPRRRTRSSRPPTDAWRRSITPTWHGPEAAGPDGGINAAWELLRDPAKRAAHDLSRRLAARDAERAADAGSASAPEEAQPHRATTPRHRARGRPAPGAARRQRHGVRHGPRRAARKRSRATGRAADRARAAATTRAGCGRPTALRAAGPPPGDPSGSVLNFGRYAGWSLAEIAGATSTTSSGSTGCRSAGLPRRDRRPPPEGAAGARARPADAQDRRGSVPPPLNGLRPRSTRRTANDASGASPGRSR